MKKNILAIIIFLCLIVIPMSVNAGTRCSYKWDYLGKNRTIVIETEDNSHEFTKITDEDLYLSFAETVEVNSDGSCPVVAFYHGAVVGNKIYKSYESCSQKLFDGGCVEATDTKKEEGGQSSENIAGENQAILDSNSSTGEFCRYRAKNKFEIANANNTFTFYIHKRENKVEYSCEITGVPCYINSTNGTFPFDDFSCSKYIYYNCEFINGVRYCDIIGTGTEEDKNNSGVAEKPDIDPGFQTGELKCDGIFSGEFGRILKQILNIIKFIVPILIIGLSIVDFVKALAAQNQDEIKKSAQKMVKRLIIGIVIFVLPTILEFLLKQAGIEFGICTLGK